jgi:heterotetrameric sarcosine oxidase gamma subunit
MTLPTTSDLPFESPIEGSGQHGLSGRLLLDDLSGSRALFHLQGRAGDALRRALGDVPTAPGEVRVAGDTIVACLRPDWFLLLVQPADAAHLARSLQADSNTRLTLTDITHGRGLLRLSGDRSGTMLPKLCGLDFHPDAFPNSHAAPTSLAKVRALIVRHDLGGNTPAYYLVVDRSHAAYVWEAVVDAMGEFLVG